ncbi:hypothetical protein [Curvibacter delicatus]|jgi:hypothetical protein|nr:hypothetical protein [Curvibacter delicatus]
MTLARVILLTALVLLAFAGNSLLLASAAILGGVALVIRQRAQ